LREDLYALTEAREVILNVEAWPAKKAHTCIAMEGFVGFDGLADSASAASVFSLSFLDASLRL
jgi:hypothetical protein